MYADTRTIVDVELATSFGLAKGLGAACRVRGWRQREDPSNEAKAQSHDLKHLAHLAP